MACSTRHTTQVVAEHVTAAPHVFKFLLEHVHQPMVSIFMQTNRTMFQCKSHKEKGVGNKGQGQHDDPSSKPRFHSGRYWDRKVVGCSVLSTSILDFLH